MYLRASVADDRNHSDEKIDDHHQDEQVFVDLHIIPHTLISSYIQPLEVDHGNDLVSQVIKLYTRFGLTTLMRSSVQ